MWRMALDDLNSNLFKPLASRNAPFYTCAIEAIYQKVALDALSDDCTPSEAREIIRNVLATSDLSLDQFDDTPDELAFDEIKDKGTRIYAALVSYGWVVELDDVGYRRIIYMPSEVMRLWASLLQLQKPKAKAVFRSTYVGVNHKLSEIVRQPNINADLLESAVIDAQCFIDELHGITGGIREMAHDLQNKKRNSEIYSVYFDELIGNFFRPYDEASSQAHPKTFQRSISQSITKLLRNDNQEIAVVAKKLGLEKSGEKGFRLSQEDMEQEVSNHLHKIYDIFERAPSLINKIATYRRSITKRVKEAMIYNANAPVMFGKDIAEAVASIERGSSNYELPAPLLIDNYITSENLYKARVPDLPAEATKIRVSKTDYEKLAIDRLHNEAIDRRTRDPYRLVAYIESAMGVKQSITSDELPVQSLEDLIAYEQTRELINNAPQKKTPFYPITELYDVKIVEGITQNNYLSSPRISITRKQQVVNYYAD